MPGRTPAPPAYSPVPGDARPTAHPYVSPRSAKFAAIRTTCGTTSAEPRRHGRHHAGHTEPNLREALRPHRPTTSTHECRWVLRQATEQARQADQVGRNQGGFHRSARPRTEYRTGAEHRSRRGNEP